MIYPTLAQSVQPSSYAQDDRFVKDTKCFKIITFEDPASPTDTKPTHANVKAMLVFGIIGHRDYSELIVSKAGGTRAEALNGLVEVTEHYVACLRRGFGLSSQ